mgnify:CR=1 FL=1
MVRSTDVTLPIIQPAAPCALPRQADSRLWPDAGNRWDHHPVFSLLRCCRSIHGLTFPRIRNHFRKHLQKRPVQVLPELLRVFRPDRFSRYDHIYHRVALVGFRIGIVLVLNRVNRMLKTHPDKTPETPPALRIFGGNQIDSRVKKRKRSGGNAPDEAIQSN